LCFKGLIIKSFLFQISRGSREFVDGYDDEDGGGDDNRNSNTSEVCILFKVCSISSQRPVSLEAQTNENKQNSSI
jgi:hypothetical protein